MLSCSRRSREPVVYWVKPNEPILWQGDELVGVHAFLSLGKEEQAEAASHDSAEAPADPEPTAKPRRIQAKTSLREQSKPNPRRIAEAKAKAMFATRAVTPSVQARDPMAEYPSHRIVVDGSPNFIAVRLPAGRDDDSIRHCGICSNPRASNWAVESQVVAT